MHRSASPAGVLGGVRRCVVAALLCGVLPAAPALADDEARRAILDLRQQFRQMAERNQQDAQQAAERDARARLQLADQIESLRNELVSLRGKVEELNWQVQQLSRSTEAPSGPQHDPLEQASYDAAMERFRAALYAEAVTAFDQFLGAYPASPLAAQAQFYRGSSLYATRQYKQAADALQELVKVNPADTRAPDALLIVAACQIELNALNAARTTLQRIVQTYPQSQAAQTATQRLQLLR